MLRPEIEIIEVLDVVTASTVAPTTTTKAGSAPRQEILRKVQSLPDGLEAEGRWPALSETSQ